MGARAKRGGVWRAREIVPRLPVTGLDGNHPNSASRNVNEMSACKHLLACFSALLLMNTAPEFTG